MLNDIDVDILFEVEVDGSKTILPHIFIGGNRKSIREIHEEIRAFQYQYESSQESKFIEWFVQLPGCVRRFFSIPGSSRFIQRLKNW
jgi:hypothetical protein